MLMKIVLLFLIISILTTNCLQKRNNTKRNIRIGVFLNEHDKNAEITLDYAIKVINILNGDRVNVSSVTYRIKDNDTFKAGIKMCKMLAKGVVAIFGPNHPETNEIIQSVSSSFEIPQFQTFWNPNLDTYYTLLKSDKRVNSNKVFNFNLHPSPATLSQALATLVRENDWGTYAVIYENDDSLSRLQEVLRPRNQARESHVTFTKLTPGSDHRTVLKEVGSSGVFNIILDCETDHIMDILWQAKEVNLLGQYHSYILASLDSHTLDFSQLGEIKANITSIRLIDPGDLREVIKDWEMMSNKHPLISTKSIRTQTVLLFDALNLFITSLARVESKQPLPHITPLECNSTIKSTHGEQLAKSVAEFGVEMNSPLVQARGLRGPLTGSISFDEFGNRINYQLQIVELTNKDFRTKASWHSGEPNFLKPLISTEEIEKEIEEGVAGKHFKVVSRIGDPYFNYTEAAETKKGNDKFEGYVVDLLEEICKILKCNYTFELSKDSSYGRYHEKNKTWDGLIKHVLDRKADLAVCDLTITYERRTAVDFSNPFMTLGISILFAKAVKKPPELLAFKDPLELDIWLYAATAYIIMSMLIFLVARMNPRDWENPHPCNSSPEELENIWTMKNCFWLTLGSIMAQGCDILPKGVSTRMIAGMWWFFSMIITACYTANLAAFLTMDRMEPSIESAEDLAAQSKIMYGCLKDGATASFFKDSNVSTYHRMWVQMESAEPTVFTTSNKDGVAKVLNEKRNYAFLMESTNIEYEKERNCKLIQVGGWLDTKGYGIAMPINAPYRKNINHAILKMQETGILKELKSRWWKKKSTCKKDENADELGTTELGIPHVGGVFVVLAGGIGIALIIAVFEFLWSVKKIALSNRLPIKKVLRQEIKFALDIWQRKKKVKRTVDKCDIINGT